jgi:hypothetical protein
MGLGPKASHFFTPVQRFAGCGAFHRRLPTGGAANGIPLKAVISPELFLTPDTNPASVRANAREVIFPVLIMNEYKKKGTASNTIPNASLLCFFISK